MDFCITDLVGNFMYYFLDLFLRAEFYSTYQFCLVFAVKLQLSSAYRLYIINVNGISGSYDCLIAQGIYRIFIRLTDHAQVLGAVTDTNSDGHCKDLSGFFADIT